MQYPLDQGKKNKKIMDYKRVSQGILYVCNAEIWHEHIEMDQV